MEVITVHASIADRNGFFHPGIRRHFERRNTPCNGKTGTSHERESHKSRRVVHLLGPVPVPREMLIVENGYGLSACLEDLHGFLKEPIARILHLAFWRFRVVSMLAYNYHSIDGELTSS